MPTIAELLTAYRDRTGASYEDMARKVGDEINRSRMHELATQPPKNFPKLPRTFERLADLLEVPVTTIVLAFAAGLGLPVSTTQSRLAQLLPARTDELLTDEDRDAILNVTRSLLEANLRVRNVAAHGSAEEFRKHFGFGGLAGSEDDPAGSDPDDLGLAARRGSSEGRRLREEQDRDAES